MDENRELKTLTRRRNFGSDAWANWANLLPQSKRSWEDMTDGSEQLEQLTLSYSKLTK